MERKETAGIVLGLIQAAIARRQTVAYTRRDRL